jgi:uncharacterized protein YcfJ
MKPFLRSLSVTAMAALIAAPLALGATAADAASCSTRKVNGTLLGAAGGALLGGAVTHGATGPIVGGLAGGVVGHEIGRSGCTPRRTYYRSSRSSYRSAPARYYAPRGEPVRKVVYYDEYGRPVYR